MRIVALEVQNFRGIKHSKVVIPVKRVLCFVGAGDSTKSTLLEAIRWNLLQSWVINAADSDFYHCNTESPIIIRGTYTELPDALLSEEKYGYYLRSGEAVIESFVRENDDLNWDDEPKKGNDLCLTVQLTVEPTLEPKWEIICNRLDPKALSIADRRLLLSNCIDNNFNCDFSWGRNSVLHHYTDESGELRSAYTEAFRKASKNIEFSTLNEISQTVKDTGKQYGIPLDGEITNQLVMKSNGISTAVELYDYKMPLSQHGLGSRRLMSIGLNVNATDGASLLLIDEVETGLEPHRVCSLIGELKRSHKDTGQVLMTTHSSCAVTELTADELLMVNSKNGITTVHSIGAKEIIGTQGFVRGNPESLLAKRLIVCEGKTEVGLLRALDTYLMEVKNYHLSYQGVCPVDGNGGDRAIKLAKHLHNCGYEVCVLMDSDVESDNKNKDELRAQGIVVFDWDLGNSIEEQIFIDVDADVVEKILSLVVDENNIVEKQKKLNSCDEVCSAEEGVLKLKGELSPEQKKHIGTVAKNAKPKTSTNETSWFKRIDHGEDLGAIIFSVYEQIAADSTLKKTLDAIIEWVKRP